MVERKTDLILKERVITERLTVLPDGEQRKVILLYDDGYEHRWLKYLTTNEAIVLGNGLLKAAKAATNNLKYIENSE